MRRDEGLLHLGKVAVIFGPFDPLGNEGSLGDPSGNEGSPPLRERRDPSPGGTLRYHVHRLILLAESEMES